MINEIKTDYSITEWVITKRKYHKGWWTVSILFGLDGFVLVGDDDTNQPHYREGDSVCIKYSNKILKT